MNPTGRIFFLDRFRAFVIVLVVNLHGAISYMAYAPEWWYVIDPQNSLFFTILVFLIDIPIMLIMFFISGYFAFPSLVKRGTEDFLRSKFIRIGAPWLVGVIFLAPLIAYMIYFSRGVPMGFFQFWATDFWTVTFQQSVYWFLGILLLFFLILAMVYDASERFRAARQQVTHPSWKSFVAYWAVMSLGMFLINQVFPIDSWYTRAYLFVFQPLRVPLYIGYFGLGIFAHLRGWFTREGYQPLVSPWIIIWLFSGLFYVINRLFLLPAASETTAFAHLAHAMLFNAFCLSSLMIGVAIFQQRGEGNSPFWASLSANSYGIYYLHPLILYPLAYIFVPVSLSIFIKAPLIIVITILLSWVVSALFLTKAPLIRRSFA